MAQLEEWVKGGKEGRKGGEARANGARVPGLNRSRSLFLFASPSLPVSPQLCVAR